MSVFAEYYPIKCLLEISKRHREAVDSSRVYDGKVIGQDNWDNLAVSTVFAAMAIEAALNDYVLSHCLFLEAPYLQKVFGEVTEQYLYSSIQKKIDLLAKCWSQEIPQELVNNVRDLIRIRNRVAHQTGELRTANECNGGRPQMSNRLLTQAETWQMLGHYEVAQNFLNRFWLPGNREFEHPEVEPAAQEALKP
jgi:hypothetical protein